MFSPEFHAYFMRLALREAAKAAEAEEVPTGCVVIRRPDTPDTPLAAVKVLARAHNQTEMLKDATAHAEMIALTQASAALGDWRLSDTVLYVTKEPCAMCAGAIVLARVPLVVWGLSDPKRGGHSVFSILNHPGLNHRPELLADVLEPECRDLLQCFFRDRRAPAGSTGAPPAMLPPDRRHPDCMPSHECRRTP
jgi:tRNA(adenine34) deaminase